MEAFLLNDKVITAEHMKSVNLKERSKYVKKYDISPAKQPKFVALQQNEFKSLLNIKKNNYFTDRDTQSSLQQCKKTKNLFAKLEIQKVNFQQKFKPIKEDCFVFNGIKKTLKEQEEKWKNSYTQRTCGLIGRFEQIKFRDYDVKIDFTHPRSPKCFINPQPSSTIRKFQQSLRQEDQQNLMQNIGKNKSAFLSRQGEKQQKMTIKQRVDKEMQLKMQKRMINCKTSYMRKNKTRKNLRIQNQNLYMAQQTLKAQTKLYSEIRQNKQNKFKQLTLNINIQKNKPFSNNQINKNTIKLLKKYHCENMQYFSKYINVNE